MLFSHFTGQCVVFSRLCPLHFDLLNSVLHAEPQVYTQVLCIYLLGGGLKIFSAVFFFLFNIKVYKTRYLRLLDYKLLNYITRTITREARNHDYPKGHLGRNPITFDQIPTVLVLDSAVLEGGGQNFYINLRGGTKIPSNI